MIGKIKTIMMVNRKFYILAATLLNVFYLQATRKLSVMEGPDTIVKTHYNILIISDLTNRLDWNGLNARLSDEDIIESMLYTFKDKIVFLDNRQMHQKDVLKWTTLTPSLQNGKSCRIADLRDFENQMERIKYLVYDAKDGGGISESIVNSMKLVRETYVDRKVLSGDIYSFLQDEYPKNRVQKDNLKTRRFKGVYIQDIYQDVIILLTDGYLEYGLNSSGKHVYEWGAAEIRKTRQIINNGGYSFEDLERVNDVPRIKALEGRPLKGVKVLCVGFHDRSASEKSGSARVKPEDDKINEYAWKDWLYRSGASLVEIEGHLESRLMVETILIDFLMNERR